MAVDHDKSPASAGTTATRRVKVGGNVLVATLIVIGIVCVVQAIAYYVPGARFDMTSSQVNSLGEATENLLQSLEQPVTLTSLYFATDLEEKDQPLYRRAVDDLLELYESTARSKVTADTINPLSDHEKLAEFRARLREKSAFKKQIDAYKERIDLYKSELDDKIRTMIQSEAELIAGLGGPVGGQEVPPAVGQIEALLQRWTQEAEEVRDQVDALTIMDNTQYSAGVTVLKSLYREITKTLQDIANFGAAQLARDPNLPPAVVEYLRGAGQRYAEFVGKIEAESTELGELEPLAYDELMQKLAPSSNPIVVETPDDAMVVEFSDVWPPMEPNMGGGRAKFKDRAFKGEEKLTSTVLRITHKEQTAVVFVRYGGPPLLMGGFMPGQPSAPYANMKRQLEDANFVVDEWDLKSQSDPPKIEPAPTRTLYVVLQPTAPQPGPMGQQSQEPPFTEAHRRMLLSALGDHGRALFVAGWYPGPFGAIPATYEYGEYLKSTWGIEVNTSELLIETVNTEPGKYLPPRAMSELFTMMDVEVGDHAIVSGAQARELALPFCAPLVVTDTPPEGVETDVLVTLPQRDTVWGVKNLQAYQSQLTDNGYMSRADGDTLGPYTLAVAATKGDAKIVVVSSRGFATDEVAFDQRLVMTSQGFAIQSRNPGNITLLINSLHWLNDNTNFMNIGKPIDAAVLAIKDESTRRTIQALTIFVWPALALAFGGFAWWTRRR